MSPRRVGTADATYIPGVSGIDRFIFSLFLADRCASVPFTAPELAEVEDVGSQPRKPRAFSSREGV